MMFLGVKRGCLLLLAVLLASSTQASGAGDITLKALRAELANGGLAPVIAHHPLTTLPGVDLERLFADSHFQRFAITGYNSNGQRFAARVRLHFADGRVGFIRLTGVPGREYRLEDLHDYTTGLSLVGLVAERRWLGSHEGKAFLEALGKTPESDTLAQLAGGRAAPLALWLAQCSGQPCEQTALEYQIEPTPPALWQLMVVPASSLPQTVAGLQKVLGDDPWLAWLVGDAALARHLLASGASWKADHAYGDNVCGTLSWASVNRPVENGDWAGCAEALLAHGMPAAERDPGDPDIVLIDGRKRRFADEVTALLLGEDAGAGA